MLAKSQIMLAVSFEVWVTFYGIYGIVEFAVVYSLFAS